MNKKIIFENWINKNLQKQNFVNINQILQYGKEKFGLDETKTLDITQPYAKFTRLILKKTDSTILALSWSQVEIIRIDQYNPEKLILIDTAIFKFMNTKPITQKIQHHILYKRPNNYNCNLTHFV